MRPSRVGVLLERCGGASGFAPAVRRDNTAGSTRDGGDDGCGSTERPAVAPPVPPARSTSASTRTPAKGGDFVEDARTAIYLKLKYRAWDQRNREAAYRRCFGYKERWGGLLQEVLHLHARGWEVGLESYNVVLRRYAGAGKGMFADRVFKAMRAHGVDPDRTSYLLLLNAHARRMRKGDVQRVIEIWRDLVGAGFSPSIDAYHALVRALCLVGKVPAAFRITRAVHQTDPAVDIKRFLTPMIAAVYKDWHCVRFLMRVVRGVQRRRATSPAPHDRRMYLEAVLKAAAEHGKMRTAHAAWHALRGETPAVPTADGGAGRGHTPPPRVPARAWARYLRAHVRSGDAVGARRIWQRMRASGGHTRLDAAGMKAYFEMVLAEVCADDARGAPAAGEAAIDEAVATFAQLRAAGRRAEGDGEVVASLGSSIHVWGAYIELLAHSRRPALAADAYDMYLDAVGKPWAPSSAVARRVARARARRAQDTA